MNIFAVSPSPGLWWIALVVIGVILVVVAVIVCLKIQQVSCRFKKNLIYSSEPIYIFLCGVLPRKKKSTEHYQASLCLSQILLFLRRKVTGRYCTAVLSSDYKTIFCSYS